MENMFEEIIPKFEFLYVKCYMIYMASLKYVDKGESITVYTNASILQN